MQQSLSKVIAIRRTQSKRSRTGNSSENINYRIDTEHQRLRSIDGFTKAQCEKK